MSYIIDIQDNHNTVEEINFLNSVAARIYKKFLNRKSSFSIIQMLRPHRDLIIDLCEKYLENQFITNEKVELLYQAVSSFNEFGFGDFDYTLNDAAAAGCPEVIITIYPPDSDEPWQCDYN